MAWNLKKEGEPDQAPLQGMPQQGFSPAGPPPGFSPQPQDFSAPPPPPSDYRETGEGTGPHNSDMGERIEELAEAIIDEKWKELSRSIDKVIEWKEHTEATITKIEEDFSILKKDFDNLHSAVLGKVGEYDQHIMTLGSEIKAMEKVFQKILPSLTENVSELGKITRELKAKK